MSRKALLKKLTTFLLACVLFSPMAHAVIQDMQIQQQGSGVKLVLIMDQPISLTSTPESDEIFVIEGFSKDDWTLPEKGTGQGGIKDYYIEEYSSGSLELVVRVDGLTLSGANMVPKGSQYHYEVSFDGGDEGDMSMGDDPLPDQLSVSRVQVGKKAEATRMVFFLNKPADFNFSVNSSGSEIFLTPDERPRWEAQTTMQNTTGLFKGYELIEQGKHLALKISTTPGTKVRNAHIKDANTDTPKYVVDLVPDTVSTIDQRGLFDEESGPPAFAIKGWESEPSETMGSMPSGKAEASKNAGLVQSMDILTQNDDTILKFITKEPLNLDVTENGYTNQVIVHLPKISWMDVNALDKNGGLINSYNVDQSSPDGTNLILNVRKGTHVIGKKTVSGGGNQVHRFIIHLNQNEAKLPEWLVDASTEKLAYEEAVKEEIETPHTVYRGGVTPDASIGQGLYAGWSLNFFGSEDKIKASDGANASRKLFTGVTGVGGDLYLGFGQKILNSIYVGGEMLLGHYLNKATQTYKNNGTYDGSTKIGVTWGGILRLGGYVGPMALFYARLGVMSTDFWFGGTKSSPGDLVFPESYSRRNRTGFLYGVGIDTALNDYTSFRFELGQINYQTFKHHKDDHDIKHRFILNQMSVGMTHHFSPLSGPAASPIYEESVVRGLYGGVIFALNTTYAKRDFSNKTDGANISYYGGSSNTDPVWGFYLGYGRAKGRFYYAGEGQVSLSESVTKESVEFGANDSETFEDSLKWRWGLAGRLGYILNHGVMAYGKLGFCAAKFKRSFSHETGAGRHRFAVGRAQGKYILGIRSGAGLEVTVNRVLGIRGDWTMDYYPKLNLKGTTEGGSKEKQTILDNRFGIGLTVYLSDALASMGLGTAL